MTGSYAPLKGRRVSVVIAAYNEAGRIGRCLASLRRQDYPGLEIIVSDDGSTDGTTELASGLGARVVRGSHRGPGAARNAGARAAAGDVLVLVDADMTFAGDYVSRLVRPVFENGAIAVCHWGERVANWENPWARCETWYLGFPDGLRQPPLPPEKQTVYRAVRRDFFLDSGGYDENSGRGDDGTIADRTGVYAVPVADAVCFHFNAASPAEVFSDASWRGRGIAVQRAGLAARALRIFLWDHNPLLAVYQGMRLALEKGEYRLVAFSALFSGGILYGLTAALITGRYQK